MAFACGVGAYFALPVEPSVWPVVGLVGAMALLLAVVRHRPALIWPVLLGLLAALGFAAAVARTHTVAAPILDARLGPVVVEGRVLTVDRTAGGRRRLLDALDIATLEPPPARPTGCGSACAARPVPS